MYINSPWGMTNDADHRISGWQSCSNAGDIDFVLNASGSSTFDITRLWYQAVELL